MQQLIEIAGLPGAGKSTVTDYLIEKKSFPKKVISLESAYWEAIADVHYTPRNHYIRDKIPDVFFEQLRSISGWRAHATNSFQTLYPEFQQIVGPYIKKYTNDCSRRQWAVQSILTLQEQLWTVQTESDFDPVVVEQGFADKARAVFAPPTSSHQLNYCDVEQYCELMPKADLLVVVDVDIETAFERMHNRTDGIPSQYEKLSDTELRNVLKRMKKVLKIVAQEWDSDEKDCIFIDNKGSIEHLYSQASNIQI